MTKEIRDRNDEGRSGDRSGSSLAQGTACVRLFACGYLRSAPVPFGRLVIRHSSFFWISSFLPRFCLVFVAFLALAQQPAASLPDEEDLPEPDDSWNFTNRPGLDASMRQMLDKLVAVGRSHEGLRYPIYSDGKTKDEPARKAEFQSGLVSRLDDTWLQFTKAMFQSFSDPKAPDAATRTVVLENAIYDIKNDLIFTNTPVKFEDKAGSIQSGAMLHDHATGLTIFSGGVELYLYEEADDAVPAAPAPASTLPAEKPTTKSATP